MSQLRLTSWLLVLVLLAPIAGGGCSRGGMGGRKYTATASVLIERRQPHILPQAAEKDDPAEFETFRETQQSLIKSRFVIMAALRDPKLKTRPCIVEQDARHNALAWLTGEIHVNFPAKNGGVMEVSATEPDPQDAAAIVNAVVAAYWNEVVAVDQQQRRERLRELTAIAADKEQEVRKRREELKQELQNIGEGDEQSMALRTQLALNVYVDFQRELEGMRGQYRILLGKQREAIMAKEELLKAEIPHAEVVQFLGNNQLYRDLESRLAILESNSRLHVKAAAPGTEKSFGFERTATDLAETKSQLAAFEEDARQEIREARRIELDRELGSLKRQAEILAEQIAGFQKQVEAKQNEAESVGRSTIAAKMMQDEIENIERVLRTVAEERERLTVELKAGPRVSILGDRNSPADVPESPD